MTEHPAGSPSLLRALNSRAVVEALDVPATRTELADRLGLSKPTVAAALAALVAGGLVDEVGQVSGRKGPAATLYQVSPEAYAGLGVDIGRVRIRAGVVDASGRTRSYVETATPATGQGLVDAVATLAARARDQAGLGGTCVVHTVIAVPGVVHHDGRSMRYLGGLPEDSPELGPALLRELGPDIEFENDINLAATVEASIGQAVGVEDFALIGLGGGLGVGLVLHGRLYRGASGAAGEAGSLPDPYAGWRPPAELDDEARKPPLPDEHAVVDDIVGINHVMALARRHGLSANTPAEVFDQARDGHDGALAVVDDTAASLAHVIAAITPIVDPALIVLGGSVGANDDLLRGRVEEHLARISPFRPRIVTSELGSHAVLLGAQAQAAARAREIAFDTTKRSAS